jgi:hypothetical protein
MAFVPGRKHDLFVSYAHKEAAWAAAFVKALADEFQVRTGREVTFWQDSRKLRTGEKWTAEIEEGIRDAAAFLAVISPTYFNSPWCGRERDIALEHELEALKVSSPVESLYRFLKIIKTPGPGNAHEELLEEIHDIRFFSSSDNYELPNGSAEFTAKIRELFRHIRDLLVLMSNSGQVLYLAPGAVEMSVERGELERELKDRGFAIKPDVLLGTGFSKGSIRKAMEQTSHAIFVLGEALDKFAIPQLEVARDLEKPALFWIQPGPQRKDMVKRIQDLERPSGSEILGGNSIRELIPQILEKLQPKLQASTAALESGAATVYVNYDTTLADESRAAARIADILRAREFQPVQAGRDGDHEGLMKNANGVLVFRATCPDPDQWLKLNAMELALSSQIFDRTRDFAAKALLVTNPARIKAQAVGVAVYSYSDRFEPAVLNPFFDGLTKARSAGVRE